MEASIRESRPKCKPSKREVEEWVRAVTALIRTSAENGAYGNLRIEIINGHVKRALLERSIIEPSSLERLARVE